ncbi:MULTISPECIES: NYN domain-containing protein [unclassified Neisseria]|uniref:NYN domain-containing protein n=1 Tax=unclassified Neisseria TaxID=2623750 RepID=UPI0026658089|nr:MULTISPECIES: NYN domain-containing protein [unclassified Neisseria]MDO1509747.1 NYN domain-containing protein [Neisseria sp. MVDL19-042950]MDO1515929.1 NYN domain-containing protein [Neisseria sp. MVDL18-041461]MDO1563042.1 NYN domain-containing protein [Neisseria sp. MVDL20-010259]
MSKIKTSFNVVEEKSARLAVLIDADNASAQDVKAILEEVTQFGEAIAKRIYGNFVSANGQWKEVINEYAIKPMQQFAFTKGKNATDGFMIIDAMDLLYTNRFDGFCIVSSDSDFTALAIRLKEQGAMVYGFGKMQTPKAFVNACSQFIYVENLLPELKHEKEGMLAECFKAGTSLKEEKTEEKMIAEKIELQTDIIKKAFESSDSEWISIAALVGQWKLLQVDIDPRTYGCKKFTDLIKKYPDIFEYEMRKNAVGTHENMYVRLKI